jgi:hypothetical protein
MPGKAGFFGDAGTASVAALCSFVDRRLERDTVRFVSGAFLFLCLILAMVSFLTFDGTYTVLGPAPALDFAGFYAAGSILNQHGPRHLYDFVLQDHIFHQVLPGMPAETKLPFVYPPLFAFVFKPLACLPYVPASLIWMGITAGIYLIGLALTWRGRQALPAEERSTTLLLALSFWPVIECWLSGQTAMLGAAVIALVLYCQRLRLHVASGLSLALCLYKPPLLVLIVPMLVIGRQWRAVSGFAAGTLLLGLLSLLIVGRGASQAYADALARFSEIMNASATEFPNWKFIDLDHTLKLLVGRKSALRGLLWIAVLVAVLPVLIHAWWGLGKANADRRLLVWCATLTWSLLLNVYVGIYDAVLLVPGVMITADILFQRAGGDGFALTSGFKYLLALLYVAPWFSQHVARAVRLQPFTLMVIALGVYQLRARK